MIYAFESIVPVVHESAFVHPAAVVSGNVTIGAHVYVGPGAALRGDFGGIVIEDGCNVQESCTVHMFPGVTVVLEEGAHVGHGAVVHGAHLGRNCLIGMNAVIMDGARIGEGAVVGALAFVAADQVIPDRAIAVGNPARVVKAVDDAMLAWKTAGTALYQALPARLHAGLRAVDALPAMNDEQRAARARQTSEYRTWAETRRPA